MKKLVSGWSCRPANISLRSALILRIARASPASVVPKLILLVAEPSGHLHTGQHEIAQA